MEKERLNISRLPNNIQFVVSKLKESANELKQQGVDIYLVGGFTRDYLLGKISDDIDIVVEYPNAKNKETMDVDVAMFLIKVGEIIAKNLGWSFPSKLFNLKYEDIKDIQNLADIEGLSNQGTLTLVGKANNETFHIDIALARSERYDIKSRKPEVKPANFVEDAKRRDFTFNTLAIDLNDLSVKDPTGNGIKDLKDGVLRTPLDPYQTFLDDPLRILRAIRMKNRFKKPDGTPFEVALDIEDVFKNNDKMSVLLSRFGEGKKVSPERLNEEITKMSHSPNFGDALLELKELAILDIPNENFAKALNRGIVDILNRYGSELNKAQNIAIWLKDLDIDKSDPKIMKDKIKNILKGLKYKNDTADDVIKNLGEIWAANRVFGKDVSDIQIRTMVRNFGKQYEDIVKLLNILYKGYDEFERRVEGLGGVEVIQGPVSGITGYDVMRWGVSGPGVGVVLKEIEYIVKILKPEGINEELIKSKLDSGEWKIIGDRITEDGEPVVDKYWKHLASISLKLKKIANKLEIYGLYKEADDIDNILKMRQHPLFKSISMISKGVHVSEDEANRISKAIDNFISQEMRGSLKYIVPRLHEIFFDKSGKAIPHGTPWHKEDMYSHTLSVVEKLDINQVPELKDKVILFLAALLHDVGKPESQQFVEEAGASFWNEEEKEGRYKYIGHDKKGALMAGEILSSLDIGGDIANMVVTLVRNHMKFHDIIKSYYTNPNTMSLKMLNRLMGYFKDPRKGFELLGILAKADAEGAEMDIETLKRLGKDPNQIKQESDVGLKIYDVYGKLQQEAIRKQEELKAIKQVSKSNLDDNELSLIADEFGRMGEFSLSNKIRNIVPETLTRSQVISKLYSEWFNEAGVADNGRKEQLKQVVLKTR